MTIRPTIPADCRRVADLFLIVGDAHRLTIILTLADGPRSPGELHVAMGLAHDSLSTTSNRLTRLKMCGLVESGRGDPANRTYTITDAGRALAGVASRNGR